MFNYLGNLRTQNKKEAEAQVLQLPPFKINKYSIG
jgi:hypothetical protein